MALTYRSREEIRIDDLVCRSDDSNEELGLVKKITGVPVFCIVVDWIDQYSMTMMPTELKLIKRNGKKLLTWL